MSLNAKQAGFVAEYLKDGNGKQAAIRAGYSPKTAEQMASRLLRIVKVFKAVEEGRKAAADDARIAVADILRGLAAVAEDKEGEATRDRLRAYELIGRHLGMFKDRVEHSGPGGDPLFREMSDIERARRIAYILNKAKAQLDGQTGAD